MEHVTVVYKKWGLIPWQKRVKAADIKADVDIERDGGRLKVWKADYDRPLVYTLELDIPEENVLNIVREAETIRSVDLTEETITLPEEAEGERLKSLPTQC